MSYDKTRQIIEIDITWDGWRKRTLKSVLKQFLEDSSDLEIKRISIREVKRK